MPRSLQWCLHYSMLTDSHCHLVNRKFAGEEDAVISRAVAAGVTRMIVPSTDLEDAPRALALAERHVGVVAAVGIHPCEAWGLVGDDWMKRIEEWSAHEKVTAIGECGLDYFHPPPEGVGWDDYKARQAEVFRVHLALAEARGLPVVVHHRGDGCWLDVVAMVRERGGRVRAQFHCFLGTWEEAEALVREGHRISFTGVVTYKNAAMVAQCARDAAEGSFFIETDAPYLAPVPHRGQRCESAFLAATAAFVAAQRGVTLEQLAASTEAAVREFFPQLG